MGRKQHFVEIFYSGYRPLIDALYEAAE